MQLLALVIEELHTFMLMTGTVGEWGAISGGEWPFTRFFANQVVSNLEPVKVIQDYWYCEYCGFKNKEADYFCGYSVLFAGCGAPHPKDEGIRYIWNI